MVKSRLACWLIALASTSIAGCSPPSDAMPAPAAKLIITAPGIYSLSAADLAEADLGWGEVDPASLRLSSRGLQQPLEIAEDDAGWRLRFYGSAADSRYTRANVYWLTRAVDEDGGTVDPSAAFSGSAADAAEPIDRAMNIVHAETDLRYEPGRGDGDPWLWTALPAPATEAFPLTLSALAPGPGRLRASFWGSTEAAGAPDHRVRLAVNGQTLADATWDGKGGHLVEADIPAGLLQEGANELRVEVPGLDGVLVDIPVLDWIEIEHPRHLIAEGDRLELDSPGGILRLSGFSGPAVVADVTDPKRPHWVPARPAGSGAVDLESRAGQRLIAAGPAGQPPPARIARPATALDLGDPGEGADWVAIGPAELLEPLGPLAEARRAEGLEPLMVPIEAVYDQFNHGLAEPEAIRAFLKHAVGAWRRPPRFVLLVGDATYDPLGHVTPSDRNRLPTPLVATEFGGETASDTALASLDDDRAPDLAIGRVPAEDAEQVRVFVRKVLAYEAGLDAAQAAADGPPRAEGGDWRRTVLAVADGQELGFRLDAERFLEQLSPAYRGSVLAPAPGAADAADAVRAGFGAGAGIVAYFGHGSVDQWGKDRIFTTEDARALENADRLPIVINMTCLTGLFTHPALDALAEVLLWHPTGGAVAVLAPTSLTLASDQGQLQAALAAALAGGEQDRLGSAVLAAWRALPLESQGARDVVGTFLLFGDPALRLPPVAPGQGDSLASPAPAEP